MAKIFMTDRAYQLRKHPIFFWFSQICVDVNVSHGIAVRVKSTLVFFFSPVFGSQEQLGRACTVAWVLTSAYRRRFSNNIEKKNGR